jgi:hypothetical protein
MDVWQEYLRMKWHPASLYSSAVESEQRFVPIYDVSHGLDGGLVDVRFWEGFICCRLSSLCAHPRFSEVYTFYGHYINMVVELVDAE